MGQDWEGIQPIVACVDPARGIAGTERTDPSARADQLHLRFWESCAVLAGIAFNHHMFELSSTSTGLLENREWSHDLCDFLEIGKDLSGGGVLGTIRRGLVRDVVTG